MSVVARKRQEEVGVRAYSTFFLLGADPDEGDFLRQ